MRGNVLFGKIEMTDQEFFNDWIEDYRKNLKKFVDKNQILFDSMSNKQKKETRYEFETEYFNNRNNVSDPDDGILERI